MALKAHSRASLSLNKLKLPQNKSRHINLWKRIKNIEKHMHTVNWFVYNDIKAVQWRKESLFDKWYSGKN